MSIATDPADHLSHWTVPPEPKPLAKKGTLRKCPASEEMIIALERQINRGVQISVPDPKSPTGYR